MAIVYRDHRSCDVIHPVYSHSRDPGRDRGLLRNLALTTRLEYFCVSRLSNGTPSSAAETSLCSASTIGRQRDTARIYCWALAPAIDQFIGWEWRNFLPYLCQLVFAAILWVKRVVTIDSVTSIHPMYTSCRGALGSKPATRRGCCRSMGQNNGRTDASPIHRPCSVYYAGSASSLHVSYDQWEQTISIKTFLRFLQILPTEAFPFLLQDWLHDGFPRLFTVTSEHTYIHIRLLQVVKRNHTWEPK